ncbi:DUF1800 domain-containing protein [Moritella marina ATCC 15381]|uniref:DUF1800 domain-containing protein n=1 Tax=Moritella marina ATCC 15381 TaxID=1202962 RepID=A0A5J6WHT0_MORMI|nr:DUF1800 domain-containing protein [Moritella marina]QFI36730.1 DUF1800 domain-containing protein [Moritella marina ATCC 15381]
MSKSLFVNGISCALLAYLNLTPAIASSTTTIASAADGYNTSLAMKMSPLATNAAAKLLYQGSFGPTPETLLNAQQVTRQQWIATQMQLAPSWHYPLTTQYCDGSITPTTNIVDGSDSANTSKVENNKSSNPRACLKAQESVWLEHAITAKDQLRQRVAFALSQILVVSSKEPPLAKYGDGLAWYYDLLVKHSFGNYRDLLQDVTLSPAMGVYLSMQGNRKANLNKNTFPDENYAREVMQLFSIGLYQLDISGQAILDKQGNKLPSYQQADVENLARVFTGWDLVENKRYGNRRTGRYDTFMELSPKQHDYNEKHLFGQLIKAGMKADKELSASLDLLFHHPNVGPFISRQLIQRLVSSNPSPEYIKRIATVFNDNGAGVRGDLGAVVQAILLDVDAQTPLTSPASKLKEPLLNYIGFLRAFSATPKSEHYQLRQLSSTFGQGAMRADSVFNFYQPDFEANYQADIQDDFQGYVQGSDQDHVQERGLTNDDSLSGIPANQQMTTVSPESQIMVDPLIIKQLSLMFKQTMSNKASFDLDLAEPLGLAGNSVDMLAYLDQLLLAGKMTPVFKAQLLSHLSDIKDPKRQLKEAIYLIVSSADYAVQP